jgi:hypothetical protein
MLEIVLMIVSVEGWLWFSAYLRTDMCAAPVQANDARTGCFAQDTGSHVPRHGRTFMRIGSSPRSTACGDRWGGAVRAASIDRLMPLALKEL